MLTNYLLASAAFVSFQENQIEIYLTFYLKFNLTRENKSSLKIEKMLILAKILKIADSRNQVLAKQDFFGLAKLSAPEN